MPSFDVGSEESLRANKRLLVQVDNRFVLLVESGEEIFAIDELCSHRAGPLSEGICERNTIVCPWHGSRFDLKTGVVLEGPARRNLRTYAVERANGRLTLSFNS